MSKIAKMTVKLCLLNYVYRVQGWNSKLQVTWSVMNSMKLVIPLQLLDWSIHTKDESKRGTAFAFIFGVN